MGRGAAAEARPGGHACRVDPAVRGAAAAPARHRRDVRRPSAARSGDDRCRRASEARAALGLQPDGEVLAVFPGSRRAELGRHLEPFVATARELQRRRPGLQVVVSVAPTVEIDATRLSVPARARPVLRRVARRHRRAAARAARRRSRPPSRTCRMSSGIARVPITYRHRAPGGEDPAHRSGERRGGARGVARVRAGRVRAATRVADALEPLLDPRSDASVAAHAGLAQVRGMLGTPGAAGRVATMALGMLQGEGSGEWCATQLE